MGALNPKLGRREGGELWAMLDPRGVGSLEIGAVHSYLADRYGKVCAVSGRVAK
jgi:hypothetical protein